jgi:Protein of unknown function (DUF4012)
VKTPPREAPAPPGRHRSRRAVLRRSRGRRRVARWLILLLVAAAVLLGAAVLDGYIQTYRLARDLEAAYPKLTAVREELRQGRRPDPATMRAASQAVAGLQRRVERARFTFGLTGALPFVGRPVDAVRLATSAATEAERASFLAADVVQKLLGGSGLIRHGAIDLQRLTGQSGAVDAIRTHLQSALDDVRAIPHIPLVSQLDHLKVNGVAQLSSAVRLATRASIGFRLLPDFLGQNGPRTYFLALQNNSDQRATGGAVLGYGLVRVDRGRIHLLRSGSAGDLDQTPGATKLPQAPPAIRWYLRVAKHEPFIHSGLNFSPDFPVVARMWAIQAGKSTHTHIDGVIGLDPFAVQLALRGQGSFRASPFTHPIDSSSVVTLVERTQYDLPQPEQQLVPEALVSGAFQLLMNPRDILTMGQGLGAALAEKRIQLWFGDPRLQGLVKSLDWDGGLDPGPADFLFVVEDKRVPNKVDFYTHQEIAYSITLSPSGEGQAEARVRLVNDTPPGLNHFVAGRLHPYALNAAMMNFYVPQRAGEVHLSQGSPVRFAHVRPRGVLKHTEGPTRVITKHVEAWPGHPAQLAFTYSIPGAAACLSDGSFAYRLRIRHQPAARPTQLSVSVRLPAGSEVDQRVPGWSVDGTVATLTTTLARDMDTLLQYRAGSDCS